MCVEQGLRGIRTSGETRDLELTQLAVNRQTIN